MSDKLTHFDETGRAAMVDISDKPQTVRRAKAGGRVQFSDDAYAMVKNHQTPKGDIAVVAELAGMMGAKRTADLIPLCHPLPLSGLKVRVEHNDDACAFEVTAEVKTTGSTGVEMEALTAVSIACLTIYDMAKAIDKGMIIDAVRLLEKSGGRSGDYRVKDD